MPRSRVRRPAVAGTFYPRNASSLSAEVSRYLAAAERAAAGEESSVCPKALIVPHAGFVYSGPVAASAYVRLIGVGQRVERVVLLGPSHRVYLAGLATSSADVFLTPLGEVPLDREAIERLLPLPQVSLLDAAHVDEHSLEVQLPFLQQVLDEFSLVPFSVGDASAAEVCEVLEACWGGDETLIVISSDLSHYLDYETARRLDAATTSAIERLRPGDIEHESACGRIPIIGLLAAASRHGLTPQTVDLRNSGDTAGSREQVVGYGAWVFC